MPRFGTPQGMAVPADLAGVGVAEAELDVSWPGRAASPSSEAQACRSRWKVVPAGMPGADRMRGRQVRCRQFAGLSTFPAGVVNSSPAGPGGQARWWARSAAVTVAGSGMTRHEALVLGGANNGRDAVSWPWRVVAGR